MATRGRPPHEETLVQRAALDAYRKLKGEAAEQPQGTGRLGIRARYNAASFGKRMTGWNPPSVGPNAALAGLQTIRNRARDSSRNDWSGVSATQKWTTNLVGIAITPRFKRIKSKTRRQEIVDLYNDFVEQSDADCVLDLYGQMTLAVRTWLDGGEVFIRRRPRSLDDDLAVPLQVQLLEPDMVPLFDADTYEGLPIGNKIRSGIETNKRGKRIAVWFYKDHPGETGLASTMPSADTLVRVAMSDLGHMFEPLRPSQMRGVSQLAPILARLRTIENYDDAVLTRQQLANLLVGFIIRKLPPMTGEEDLNGFTGTEVDETDAIGRPLAGLQPGLLQELDDGQEVQWSNPPEAGTNYSEYMRTQHLGTSAATGLPYEVFSGDIKDISDRTLRVIINEFRRLAEQRQWQIIIPMMCKKIIRWFADAALLTGKINLEEHDAIRRAEWSPHGWAHIHPVQDPQGKLLEIEGGLRSRSSVIGERGDDPDVVDEERAADKKREDELGLTPPPPDANDPNDPNAPADDDTQEEKDDKQQIKQANALLQAFARLEEKRQATPAAAPVINATINMPTPNVSVTNNVEPTPLEVQVSAPNVSVEAPNVQVENRVETPKVQVDVAAPNVQVHNEVDVPPAEVKVHLPKRQTDTTIYRNSDGEISRTQQVEKDLDD